jgi:hypothetical protein
VSAPRLGDADLHAHRHFGRAIALAGARLRQPDELALGRVELAEFHVGHGEADHRCDERQQISRLAQTPLW